MNLKMMCGNDGKPATDPGNKYHSGEQKPAKEPQRKPLRYNPRLVFTNPDDYFNKFYSDLLMEQQEQQ